MKLKSLIECAGIRAAKTNKDIDIKGISSDSKKIAKGHIFVAIKGENTNGHKFIQQAVRRGAQAVIIQDRGYNLPAHKGVVYLRVNDTRSALADLATAFWGNPALALKPVGITGTNGKTTVCYLIEAILKSAGANPGVITTIEHRFKGRRFAALNTTPGPGELQALLAEMKKEKVDYAIVEVSSHALNQARVKGVKFIAGIFTNLSAEHLDYHCSLRAYFTAKSRLFRYGLDSLGFAILNADDAYAPRLAALTPARVVRYGLIKSAEVCARSLKFSLRGGEFTVHLQKKFARDFCNAAEAIKIKTPLFGRHNVYNILAALAFALTQRINPEAIKKAVEKFSGAPGRLERVALYRGFYVFVDYAHTEAALRNVLESLRPFCKGRLSVVFGCGGDRDKAKRPKMGRVATELADSVFVTNDNPRNESPAEIIRDIASGMDKGNFQIIPDRRAAIKAALAAAAKQDIILIAGKGHENYQIIKGRLTVFDDREVVRRCLGLKKY